MGKPAVAGIADLTVDVTNAAVHAGGRTVPEGTLIAIDGTGGEVIVGSPRIRTAAADPHLHRLLEWADEVSGDTPNAPGPNASTRPTPSFFMASVLSR